jgi:uncharacterized membrane protein
MIHPRDRSRSIQGISFQHILLFTLLSAIGAFLIARFWSQLAGFVILLLLLTCIVVAIFLYFYQENLSKGKNGGKILKKQDRTKNNF